MDDLENAGNFFCGEKEAFQIGRLKLDNLINHDEDEEDEDDDDETSSGNFTELIPFGKTFTVTNETNIQNDLLIDE